MKCLMTGDEAVARGHMRQAYAMLPHIRELPAQKFWRIWQLMMKFMQSGRPTKRWLWNPQSGQLLQESAVLYP